MLKKIDKTRKEADLINNVRIKNYERYKRQQHVELEK
jgi:hypothetical protein